MKYISFLLTFATLACCHLFQTVHAQSFPVCEYRTSDTDGDGFGWENRATCIVSEDSQNDNAQQVCVDEDGDGWGWNGSQFCAVEADSCVDSPPLGDGWGWNGVASCRLSTYVAPFDELEVFLRYVLNFPARASVVVLVCDFDQDGFIFTSDLIPDPDDFIVNLQSDGFMSVNGRVGNGTWSTGFSSSDGVVHMTRPNPLNPSTRLFSTLVFDPDSFSPEGLPSAVIRGFPNQADQFECVFVP